MGAADATLTEALTLLRTQWATETEGLLNGNYSFWLGSGISRERYPDLAELISWLLSRLQADIDPSNSHCPYSRALNAILALTTANGVDVTKAPVTWPNLDDILAQLSRQYSSALDVELRVGGAAKELFWDVLKLQALYGDPTVPPDAEHRFLALLVEEGVVCELVTTNWDPLIELASEACRPGSVPTMKIVACNEEVVGSSDTGARLLKIHGCARKAVQNPGVYRAFLVVTKTHIIQWSTEERKRPFLELVRSILRERPALFIGLSGQDHNLQEACFSASLGRESFPTDTSRVLFTATSISEPQHGILKVIYRCYSDHAEGIDARAALPLCAKPLLGCLYLLALERKILGLLDIAPTGFTGVHRALIERAVGRIETSLCERYDEITDPDTRWRQLADEVPVIVSRFLSIYRRQEMPPTPEAYECVSNQGPIKMITNPITSESGLPWLFLAIALIVEGEIRSLWTAKPGQRGGENGQLALEMRGRSLRVFVINGGDTGMAKLTLQGFVDAGPETVIMYPSEREPLKRPSLRRSMPGGPIEDTSEVWLRDIIDDVQSLEDLMEEFKGKLG